MNDSHLEENPLKMIHGLHDIPFFNLSFLGFPCRRCMLVVGVLSLVLVCRFTVKSFVDVVVPSKKQQTCTVH